MTTPPPPDDEDDTIPAARLVIWGSLALVLLLGLYLYFRFQPGTVPLIEKVD